MKSRASACATSRRRNYSAAAEAFRAVLAKDPGNHDALYNLANSYLALEDGKNLIDAAQKLIDSDPLNQNNFKDLLANGYKFDKNQDKQIEVVVQMQAMTVAVSVEGFALRKDGAKITGTATRGASKGAPRRTR